jgi:hypothetical protein
LLILKGRATYVLPFLNPSKYRFLQLTPGGLKFQISSIKTKYLASSYFQILINISQLEHFPFLWDTANISATRTRKKNAIFRLGFLPAVAG